MRIAVLCGHEPTLDPRIIWLVNMLHAEGHDVRLVGTEAEKAKTDDPEGVETHRINTQQYARNVLPNFDLSLRHMGLMRVYVYVFLLIPAAFLALYRLIVAPIVILAFLFEKVPVVRNIVAELEVLFLKLKWGIRKGLDKVFNGGFSRLRAGMIGYKWYFYDHAMGYAIGCEKLLSADWKPDLIVANDPDTLLAGSLLKNKLGCRYVYDAHEFGPDAYLMEPSPRQAFHIYERLYMSNVDAAMTVTPQIEQEFRRVYENSPEFLVLPNATPRHTPDITSSLFDDMDTLGAGKIRFLFQGGFAANRGVEELIEEFANSELEDAVLFIRGPDNPYRKFLVSFRDGLAQKTDNIFFLDSIGEDLLIDSATHADVGLITYLSHIENHHGACPNKLSQYMQAGIFVLSSNLPFVKGVIEESGAGAIYNDQEPGDLSRWLKKLVKDQKLLKKAGANGKLFAANKFCYEYYFDEVRKVLFAQ